MSAPLIKKGAQICCSNCGLLIARLAVDLYDGELIAPETFEFTGPPWVEGEMICDNCGGEWGKSLPIGSLYVSGTGWVPPVSH